MADCVVAKITDNLIAALTGKTIEVNDASVTTFAEGQRITKDTQGHNAYIEVAGPWPEEMETTGLEKHSALHYVVEMTLSGINDTPPANPITHQTRNAGADLVALIMADLTRGGNALLTEIIGLPYYYISGTENNPEFIIRVDVSVQVFTFIDTSY